MQISWNTPVHIVTYYRYLRFFRDGTAISLLTTTEPADVVHHLTKEALVSHRDGSGASFPSAVMKSALHGRWRMSSPSDLADVHPSEAEGDVIVETEGVDPIYIYKMHLGLRSAGRGAKNNKLLWKGYWSYHTLTDDVGEFTLRNDKAFFWSRVKSYGLGA
jgi:F-box protein 9